MNSVGVITFFLCCILPPSLSNDKLNRWFVAIPNRKQLSTVSRAVSKKPTPMANIQHVAEVSARTPRNHCHSVEEVGYT